jgi:hypothetical protein
MARGNDGHSMQNWPYPNVEGQDQKYFPLGTSKTRPAGKAPDTRTTARKFEDGLTDLLGSREKARDYIRRHSRQTESE